MLVPKSCLTAGLGKDGVLARKRRIFADWSPGWARARFFSNPSVVSPRRNVGSCSGCESNWLSLLFPLPLCGPRSISVTSVPLVPPSAAAPWVAFDSCQVTTNLPSPGVKSRIGESGAAPPVAEQASRFRGICRSVASGRKSDCARRRVSERNRSQSGT